MTDKLDPQLEAIIALEQRGYRSRALKALQGYLQEQPESAAAWYYQARWLTQPRKQWQALQRSLALDPSYPPALELQQALLEEYPWLTPRFFTRERRLVLFGALLLAALSVAAALLLPEWLRQEPEFVVIVPTEVASPSPAATQTQEVLIVTSTASPGPTRTIAPTPDQPLIAAPPSTAPSAAATRADTGSPTPRPTINVAVQGFDLADYARRVVLAPLQNDDSNSAERLLNELRSLYASGTFDFALLDAPISSREEAATVAAAEGASLLIYGAVDGQNLILNFYANDERSSAQNHSELAHLLRPAAPWEIALEMEATEFALHPVIPAVLGYLNLQHEEVSAALSPLFTVAGRSLNPSEQQLLLLLAYSEQAQGGQVRALEYYDLLSGYPLDDPAIAINRSFAMGAAQDVASAIQLYETQQADFFDPAFIQTNIGILQRDFADDPAAAQAAFEEAARLNPIAARPYLELARLSLQQDDPSSASTHLATAISTDASFAPAYVERAGLRLATDDPEGALVDIENALTLQPLIGSYHALHGRILLALHRYDEALAALQIALQLEGEDAQLRADLAAAYLGIGDHAAAAAAVESAVALNPDTPTGWLQQGRLYLAQGQAQEAVAALTQGLALAPDSADLFAARCAAYNALERAEATSDCDRALALNPSHPQALEQRGVLRGLAGDVAGAAEDFQAALAQSSELYAANYYLGLYALQARDFDSARSYLTEALRVQPNAAAAYAARGVANRISENWQQAITDLEQALVLDPSDPYSYYELGLVYRSLGDLAYDSNNRERAQELYASAETAFLNFLNGVTPSNPFVVQAQEGLNYVRQALEVVQEEG